MQVSTWTLRHVVSHFALSEEPAKTSRPRARWPGPSVWISISHPSQNRKEPVHGLHDGYTPAGSHFGADDRLRDGGQNKAARSFTRAGGSEGTPWRTMTTLFRFFSQTTLGSIKSFWGWTLGWHVRKAAVNQGARSRSRRVLISVFCSVLQRLWLRSLQVLHVVDDRLVCECDCWHSADSDGEVHVKDTGMYVQQLTQLTEVMPLVNGVCQWHCFLHRRCWCPAVYPCPTMLAVSRFHHVQDQRIESISTSCKATESPFRWRYGIFDSNSECFLVRCYRRADILPLAFLKPLLPRVLCLPRCHHCLCFICASSFVSGIRRSVTLYPIDYPAPFIWPVDSVALGLLLNSAVLIGRTSYISPALNDRSLGDRLIAIRYYDTHEITLAICMLSAGTQNGSWTQRLLKMERS